MYFIYYNVSLDGKHLFRTDEYLSSDVTVMRIELLAKFKREDGYVVSEIRRLNSSERTEIN